MRTELMTAFVAENSDTQVEVEVERVGGGAGQVNCFECDGAGVSPFPADLNSARTASSAKIRALFW
jgi:hypothetical protein